MNFCITGESRIMNVPPDISVYTEITVPKSRTVGKFFPALLPYRSENELIMALPSVPALIALILMVRRQVSLSRKRPGDTSLLSGRLYDDEQVSRALVWQEIDIWIGQCIEIDVASCGETEDKATRNLIKALQLHFDDPGHCHVRHYSLSIAPMRRSMRAHLVEIEIVGH
jgi:hypothetical protein